MEDGDKMNYFEAIHNLSFGETVVSVASGRVIRPSEVGQIWAGVHWASHTTLHLTKRELEGLWELKYDDDIVQCGRCGAVVGSTEFCQCFSFE